ncbi:MAG TPA: hypothetical protein PKD53_16385 [Chloroflexaceae bacterium]|nr:hypothetical protein [Chloroflexaceae bacterium]
MRQRRLLPLALLLALLAVPLAAQVGFAPLALVWERAVAATTAGEYEPAVAVAPDGTTVAVWWERDDDTYAVRFSSFDLRGAALAADRLVAEVEDWPADLEVATDAAGNFVVGYLSGGLELHGFTAAGEGRPELRQSLPADAFGLAVAPDGRVAVAWAQSTDYYRYTLRLRQISATGAQEWTQTVDTLSSSTYALTPAVATDGAGGSVVVYNYSSYEADGHRIRRYGPTGELSWRHDRLDGGTAQTYRPPEVATDAAGNSIVVWDGEVRTESYPYETTEYGALYRRFGPDGTSPDTGQPPWLRPGGQTASRLFGARIAALDPGLFVFAWRDDGVLRFARLRFGDGATEPAREAADAVDFFAVGAGAGQIALAWDNESGDLDSLSAAPAQAFEPGVSARLYAPINSYSLATSTAGTHEGSGEPVVFTITRGIAEGASAIGYSLGGTAQLGRDYDLLDPPPGVITATGRLRFAHGERTQRISLKILDDPLGEPLKTIVLRLSSPSGRDELTFPVALITLGDDDLAEVRIVQTGGRTVVRRGDPPDRLAVALRTVPSHRVVVTLTPNDRRLNLGMGYGAPLRLVFEPDERAREQQWVEVFTVPEEGAAAGPAANAGIGLAARSADPGYDVGARFTVDGRDLDSIPVELVTRPGESPSPALPSAFLPMVVR